MKKYFWDYAFLLSIAGVIIGFDQWTKILVRQNLGPADRWSPWPWLEPYARIVNWHNTGAAFGMLQDFGKVFMVLAILVSLAILYYFPRVERGDWLLRLALSMQLGGAVGNLIDRFYQGYVTDFISVGTFAVFNVADASISTGVAVLLLGVWIKEREEREKERVAIEERLLGEWESGGEGEGTWRGDAAEDGGLSVGKRRPKSGRLERGGAATEEQSPGERSEDDGDEVGARYIVPLRDEDEPDGEERDEEERDE